MTVNYTTNLSLGQPVTGTESGTWGDDVNNAVTSYLDIAIAGGLAITVTTTDVTLTITQGTSVATNIGSTTAQYAILNVSGAMTAARNLIVPSSSRIYLINNNTTGGFALTVKGSATTGVTLVNGEKAHVFWNGSDYAKLSNSQGGAGSFTTLSATGVATFSAGTAALPAITTTGDTNTGIYFPAADTIAFTEGGAEAMRIDSSGNVGIGTASPSTKLHVAGASAIARIDRTADASANPELQFTAVARQFNAGVGGATFATAAIQGSYYLYDATAADYRFVIDSAGLVGIGTSDPTSKLHVVGGRTDLTAASETYALGVRYGTGTGIYYIGATNSATPDLVFSQTGGSERMRLTNAGTLGVGTSSPAAGYKLSVNGTGNFYESVSGLGRIFLGDPSDASGYIGLYRSTLGPANSTTAGNGLNFASLDGYTFNTSASSAFGSQTERMRIDSSGNVGIGTSSPQSLLDLTGNDPTLRFTDNAGSPASTFSIRSTDGTLKFRDVTNSSDRVTIDSSGRFMVAATAALGSSTGTFVAADDVSAIFAGVSNGQGVYISCNATSRFVTYNSSGPLSGGHIWQVGNGEAARIDLSNNLLVGTTSQLYGAAGSRLNVDAGANGGATLKTSGGSAQSTLYSFNSATTGDNAFISFGTEGTFTQRGLITYNRTAGLVAYNTTSDYRAKDISGPVTGSGTLIDSVPVYMGKMKYATQERPMFLAHETPAYAHTGEKDAVDKDGNPVYQQMDASALIPVMWAEIQSLRKRLTALEST